jgi:hypothetical protein
MTRGVEPEKMTELEMDEEQQVVVILALSFFT